MVSALQVKGRQDIERCCMHVAKAQELPRQTNRVALIPIQRNLHYM